jgi:L-lactate dehydrogenase complex protein LldG
MSGVERRDAVLGAIRASLGVRGSEKSREAVVQKRLERHPSNLLPERAQRARAARIDLFAEMLEGQGAKVTRVKGLQDVAETIARYLRENNLPAELRTGDDPVLARIPWTKTQALTRLKGRGQGTDAVAMSRATAAAAETGTLFLVSGPDNPTTLNFLPDTHIALIRADDILGSYEDGWNRLRDTYGSRSLPRTVNLISGPSRTADIEQVIVMGAHGPRRLHVIIVE